MDITNLQNQVTLVEDDLARATTPADFRRLSTLIDETTELTIQQIRNYSNAGGIADKRKLETILNRCKYLDARIKQSLIKTGEGVSGGSDESSVTYYDLESAFKGRIKTGIVINNNILDPKEFLEEAQPIFVDKIEASLQKRIPNMKANVVLCADYKMKLDDTVQAKYFNTSNFIISRSSDLISIFGDMEISLLSQMGSFEEVGSGGSFSRINSLAININKYSPLRASKFIELPTVIKSKHAIINVKNTDNECFYYALVSALYPCNTHHKELPSSYPQNFKQLFNIKGIKSPVKITDIPKFERQNPNISVNVYGLQGSKVMGPLYHTKSKKQHHINLLYVRKRKASHYCWIKNMSRLCRSSITKHANRTFICDRCLRHFRSVQSLNNHLDDCEKFDAVHIEFDKPGENTLSFKNLNFNLRHPFVVYADFECLTVPCNQIDDDDDDVTHFKSCTIPYQKHIPFAVAYQVVCSFDPSLSHYKSYVGTNPQKWLVNELIKETAIIEEKIKINIPMLPLTLEEQQGYDNTTLCPHCLQEFNEDLVVKVRNHDHFTGKFLSALCQNCNLQYKCGNYIPILFHNMSGYDIHFIINELNFNREPVNILPVTRENYISVSKKCAKMTWRFIDSYRFLARSLDVLANNLAPEMFNFVREAFPNPEQFNLVRRKGIFCYDYMNSWGKLNETELPPKESFYNALREEHISCEDYEHVQNVWKTFNIKSLAQYSELYLKCDVKILADVFEQFRDLCMKIYDLDSVHFYTGPGLAWSAALKCTRVKLDLLTDIDMVLFFEKAIRGGITQCSHRYAKANNKYMKENYNEKEPSSCLLYVDANNLYGYAMSESLPYGNFEWLSENRVREIENILKNFKCEEKPDWEMYTDRACMLALNMAVDEEEAPTSLILEVDLNVPREIQDKTSAFPFCPEHRRPPTASNNSPPKLMLTMFPKFKYVLHVRNLFQCLLYGLQLTKVHRVLKFSQRRWLKPYIDLNTSLRAKAKNEFEKDFFKLMNNAVFGKTMQNIRKHRKIKLAYSFRSAQKYIALPEFRSCTIFKENLVAVELNKTVVKYNQPVYLGMVILDLSKLLMYSFHYQFMLEQPCPAILLYTDTDGMVYACAKSKDGLDIYDVIREESAKGSEGIFDTSDYPPENPYGIQKVNKKVPGKFKDELNGKLLLEFVGLKSKMYSMRKEEGKEVCKAKGVGQQALKNRLSFEHYFKSLFDSEITYAVNRSIRSDKHNLYTYFIRKKALDSCDDKRFILKNKIDTLPWGHFKINEEEEEGIL